jgi:hypothetical protein
MRRLFLLLVCLSLPAGAAEPMDPDMPMKGEMKKKGMKRGDVKKAAQKKKQVMQEMMDAEAARKAPAK